MLLCTPHWGKVGEHAYPRWLLDRITVGTTKLANGPIYVPQNCQQPMLARKCGSFLSIAEGSLT